MYYFEPSTTTAPRFLSSSSHTVYCFFTEMTCRTIPQLFIGGEFIGGCDIVTSMHESGELKEFLNEVMAKEK